MNFSSTLHQRAESLTPKLATRFVSVCRSMLNSDQWPERFDNVQLTLSTNADLDLDYLSEHSQGIPLQRSPSPPTQTIEPVQQSNTKVRQIKFYRQRNFRQKSLALCARMRNAHPKIWPSTTVSVAMMMIMLMPLTAVGKLRSVC